MKIDEIAKQLLLKGKCCYTCDHLSIDKRYCTINWHMREHLSLAVLSDACDSWKNEIERSCDFEVPMTPHHNDVWVNFSSQEYYVYIVPAEEEGESYYENEDDMNTPHWAVHELKWK